MSSNESSGAASAEATSTTPAPSAEFPTFGSTRGSGLARGKRPAAGPAVTTAAAPSNYTPTAIEVVHAPREYTNPFAPAEAAPAVEAPVVAIQPARIVETAPVVSAPVVSSAPVVEEEPAHLPDVASAKSELNILPPAEQKSTTAQTWESDGFSPTRAPGSEAPRSERPRREERPRYEAPREEASNEPVDLDSIPEKFLYVRPGVTFVPTPRNWGGAPRERSSRPPGEGAPQREEAPRNYDRSPAAAPAKSGGFFGWLKSLFGGPAAAEPASAGASSNPHSEGGERSHRGGRNRGGRGGEGGGGGGGGHRRSRGGRGRSRSGGGESEGSRQGGI